MAGLTRLHDRKRYADLTEAQGVTPVYWQMINKSPSPREEGWEIIMLNPPG